MHKHLWNSLKIELTLTPVAPLLIKAGGFSPNPALPDMQFVRTYSARGETVFIPGSSLKGVFRNFTEKVLRTANSDWACQPFPSEPSFCGRKIEEERNSARIYGASCRACKIYGNTRLRGRLSFSDLYPHGETHTETRYGVAISRLSHAVAVGPFDMEVLVQGQFIGTLVLDNFEVWQLSFLALTMQAINDGLVKVGFGKNRGLGQVEVQPRQVTIAMSKKVPVPANEIWGAGLFASAEERSSYGLSDKDKLAKVPEPAASRDLGVLVRRDYTSEQWKTLAQSAIESLAQLLEVRP